ncbi:hypothetical protein OOK60_01605 [Trichothermofontia sichuanensis B231]|uniref:hypothetical protein n=1 Tax=Trichothermofontia sichuanensis TaxID=3045816 RepID=UPI0022460A83|nr:hypothetical protein [Trichothermofontia sichuanensis]UZQ54804.1 hypothetical protein OOK60_01605 [Trichothermofontia sichuanensis B231]
MGHKLTPLSLAEVLASARGPVWVMLGLGYAAGGDASRQVRVQTSQAVQAVSLMA